MSSGAKYERSCARLAFIACEGNDKLLVLDLTSRNVVSSFDVAKDPDVLALDPKLGWLYVAGESGQVSPFKVQGKAATAIATARRGPNAHVVAVDPATHEAFFPLKPAHGKPMLRITRPSPEVGYAIALGSPGSRHQALLLSKKESREARIDVPRGQSVKTCCDFACDRF